MPCELIMRGSIQPRRISQRWDTTLLNLSQALSNEVAFMMSNDFETGRAVATRVDDVLEIIDISDEE